MVENNEWIKLDKKKTINPNIKPFEYAERKDITEVNIPNGVTTIGERAFAKCTNLKKLIIPDSVTTIGASAFNECENLEEVVLSKNIKKLNYRTFADCKRLKKIIIPEGIKELDWAVFSGCENIEEIVLPSSIKTINKQLFLNCKKLKSIILPKNITYLPDECFRGCKNLDIILDENIIELGNGVFQDCLKLSTYPSQVEKVGSNCFKNCRSLKTVLLNEKIDELKEGTFDGCVNLTSINYNNDQKIRINKKVFRNCKSLTSIPNFIANFSDQAFENCEGLTKINIIDSTIPFACFRGCTNLVTIHNQDKIFNLGAFAFSGCESLEEVYLSYTNNIAPESFSNCKKLTKVRLNMGVRKVGSRAFYNCENLKDINLPDVIDTIGKEAFRNCHSISCITIPANLTSFGDGAFSYMDSLERIEVSPHNKTFITPDNKILIHQMYQKLMLYANGCKDKSYSLKDYNFELDMFNHALVRPITGIGKYAFAGAKHLEELNLCCCTTDIEHTAFYDCPKLKTLKIHPIAFYTAGGFNLRTDGRYYFEEAVKTKPQLPFEIVEFCESPNGEDNLIWINQNALPKFKNVTKVILPKVGSYFIGENAFHDCQKLEEVEIPNNVTSIGKGAFPTSTKLKFENGLQPEGLIELIHNDQYIGDYKLYVLEDGTYYIEQDGKITTLSKQYIDEVCSHSEYIIDNPILFIDFMNDLLEHNLGIKFLFNGILFENMSLENRKILFDNLNKNDKFFINVLKNSKLLDKKDDNTELLLSKTNFQLVIDFINILRKYNINHPLLHNKFLMANYDLKSLERIINLDLPLLIKTLEDSKLFDNDFITLVGNGHEDKRESYYLTYEILKNNVLEKFIRLAKKYNIKDKYLFEKPFISIADNTLTEQLFKIYDANTKRLLKSSLATETNIGSKVNLSNLMVLMKITGALEEDPIIRQRASTFIVEKLFEEKLPNGENNEYRIIGNDIHRIFDFYDLRGEFDEEFAQFFLENYQELIKEEKQKSGFIQRVYLNFREISRTSSSNKGSQRHLKVTIDKCKSFLSNVKFDGVTEENKDFAELIGAWYDTNTAWINAQIIHNESLKAPRNIFTEETIDEEGNIIYDNDPSKDLREDVNPDFSYEWLPKQDYDNLILGKYCSCCAHIEGAGQGIMRASMILDCCQNLVIRNNLGQIIAKSTIFVNKEKGYAVFNNVETSLNYRDKIELGRIYEAFLRGANAFVVAYNENHKSTPLHNISIGANRNTILDYLTDAKHPVVDVQQALQYGSYSLSGSGYSGDWTSKQRLVLKR